eukprot:SAG31_NODE_3885_length_3786_cov_2.016554_3_plen_61_part_00
MASPYADRSEIIGMPDGTWQMGRYTPSRRGTDSSRVSIAVAVGTAGVDIPSIRVNVTSGG